MKSDARSFCPSVYWHTLNKPIVVVYKFMKSRVLILGGEGFIGRNIVNFLPSDKYECFSVGVQETVFNKNRRDKFISVNPYKEKVGDGYDVIIHLIDNDLMSGDDFESAERDLISNVNISQKNHLILFSSAAVYANPDSDYGKRKIKLEKIYENYCKENRIKLTIFRLFNTYGPYLIPHGLGSLVANIFYSHLNNEEIEINDIEAKRDFIYSADIVEFVDYVILNQVAGKFDLATNQLITVRELLKKIEEVIGDKLNVRNNNKKDNVICPMAKNDLLDKVEICSLEDGIRETYEFYRKSLLIINRVVNQ